MLAQDTLTGALYDIPETFGEAAFDGLGFPIPFLGPLVSGAASLLPRLFGGGGGAAPAPPNIPGIPSLGNIFGQLRGLLGRTQVAQRPLRFMAPPWPLGWVRPPEDYMPGFHPRRTMMRCTLWPGPQGLIPQQYLHFVPPAAPGLVSPVVAPVPPGGMPGAMRGRFGGRGRHRGFRRRR